MLGLCFATGRILGVTSAFGVALAAACPRKYSLQSALGAVVGYLLLPAAAGVPQAGAVAVIAALRFVTTGTRLDGKAITSGPVLALAAMTLTGVAAFKGPVQLYDGVIFLAQAALAPAAAFFVERALGQEGSTTPSDTVEKISIAITVGIVLTGLIPLGAMGISLGRVAGLFSILIGAYCAGAGAGAAAGAVLGLVTGFVTGDFTTGLAAYSLIGLISGTFAGAGRGGCAASMVATGGFLLLTGIFTGVAPAVEIAAASIGFMLLPPQLLRVTTKLLTGREVSSAALKTIMDLRLGDTVTALREICTTTRQVSEKLDHMAGGGVEDIYSEVGDKLCRKCGKKMTCWGPAYSSTADAISAGLDAVRGQGTLACSDLPVEFLARCEQPVAFARTVESSYTQQVVRAGLRHKVSTMRWAVTDQFEGLAMYLQGVREELDSVTAADGALSAKVEELFTNNKLEPAKALCHKNSDGRLIVTALLPAYKAGRAESATITGELSTLLKKDIELAGKKEWGDGVYITYRERAIYVPEFGGYQISCGGHSLCGDTYRQFSTLGATAHMVLSDGMGSGGSAAVDSAMAANLTERLVTSGADYHSALRLVNSALLIKSGEETLATIDAASLNLYSGKVDFYKAGAAPTIIRHNGRAACVESTSIPAGILTGVDFEHSSVKLRDGDLVLMMSDGVCTSDADWVVAEVLTYTGEDLNEFCKKIAEAARLRRTDGREDDITVICMRMKENAVQIADAVS